MAMSPYGWLSYRLKITSSTKYPPKIETCSVLRETFIH